MAKRPGLNIVVLAILHEPFAGQVPHTGGPFAQHLAGAEAGLVPVEGGVDLLAQEGFQLFLPLVVDLSRALAHFGAGDLALPDEVQDFTTALLKGEEDGAHPPGPFGVQSRVDGLLREKPILNGIEAYPALDRALRRRLGDHGRVGPKRRPGLCTAAGAQGRGGGTKRQKEGNGGCET